MVDRRTIAIRHKISALNHAKKEELNLKHLNQLPANVVIKTHEHLKTRAGVNMNVEFPFPRDFTFYPKQLLEDVAKGLHVLVEKVDMLFAKYPEEHLRIKIGKKSSDICEHSFGDVRYTGGSTDLVSCSRLLSRFAAWQNAGNSCL